MQPLQHPRKFRRKQSGYLYIGSRRSVLGGTYGRAFDPSHLFAAGEQGVWYDPSDFSAMFQDASGTVPVTAAGQPVGLLLDKSGRGNHAAQPSATARPVLQQDESGRYYLLLDGIDDFLVAPDIDFTDTDKMTLFAGVRKLRDTPQGVIVELSTSTGSNPGSFLMDGPSSTSAHYRYASNGSALAAATAVSGFPAPITSVLVGSSDIPNDRTILRINGAQVASSFTNQGAGNYGNYPLYIGRRAGATAPFFGRLYALIARGAATSSVQIAGAVRWLSEKTGVF